MRWHGFFFQRAFGAPTIAPIPDREDTVYNGGSRSAQVGFSIDISNSPTGATATGLPPAVGFERTPVGFRFTWANDLIGSGVYNVVVAASNGSGSTSRTFRWVVRPSMMSHIFPDKSSYTVGDVITLTARYPVPVVVAGSPYIELWPGKNAVYSSGSGGTDLRFQAAVTASDTTHTGLSANAITAGNGTIATPGGASANLIALASPDRVGGRAPLFAVVVPQTAPAGPAITGVTPPSAGVYGPQRGGTISLTVNFNSRVTVTGLPSIGVRIGSTDREFGSGTVSASGTGVVFFLGNVAGDMANLDGTLRITGPIRLNGGTLKGADGTDAMLSLAPVDVPSVAFDATAPAPPIVSGVTPASPTTEQSFVIAGTAEANSRILFRTGTASIGSAGSTTVDPSGNWSATFPARGAGTYALFALAQDAVFNNSSETAITVTVRVPSQPLTTPVPVISNATVVGEVGRGITPVQVTATNTATSFSAPGLASYGLAISAGGLVTGTPAIVANGVTVPVMATNATGTSAPATLTLNISAAPTTPTTTTPTITIPTTTTPTTTIPTITIPTTTSPTTTTTTTTTKILQTITFDSPVSGFVINQPVTLGATSSAALPITYALVSGNATLEGNVLTPRGPGTIVVRAAQAGSDAVAPASVDVDFGSPQRAAQIIALTPSAEVMSDGTLSLSATSNSGLPITFQIVSGPAMLQGNVLAPTEASGTVTLRAVQAGNESFAPAELSRTITIIPASRLINISSRALVREGDASRAFIAGFVVAGTAPKRILVRAVGPALNAFGVEGAVANPRLRLFDSAGRVVAENDDWTGTEVAAAFGRVGAFDLAAGSRDAALLVTLAPGAFSLHVEAAAGQGVALAEVYDASGSPALERQQIVNISTRAFVGTGEGILTAGFVVTGSLPKRILIRGIGPSLEAFGVTGSLADPVLKLHQGSTVIAQNDDWEVPQAIGATSLPGGAPASGTDIVSASSRFGAFALVAGSKDAALLLTLAPGVYTVALSGADNTTGTALVEVYQAPDVAP